MNIIIINQIINMKNLKLIRLVKSLIFLLLLAAPILCRAMPPGTLLYRTSSNGKMFGYSGDPLIYSEKGIIKDIYAGHAAIYIGQENGEDYIVEAMNGGIVKTPAKYFVNRADGETLLGAKIPIDATPLQLAKVVALAKSLASSGLAYDFDFKTQKGPKSGEWTCVGLTEKLYESANIANPNNLNALEYDPDHYAVNITPDGFDNYSIANASGDCFSRDREFSLIARRKDLIVPAPELIGFDVGLVHNGERYIFLPYTQFLQPSLKNVAVDIPVVSSFVDNAVRGSLDVKALVLRWSLINNPVSSLKNIAGQVKDYIVKAADKVGAIANKVGDIAKNIGAKIFGSDSGTALVLDNQSLKNTASTTAAKKTTAKKTTTAAKTNSAGNLPKVTVNKAAAKTAVVVASSSKTATGSTKTSSSTKSKSTAKSVKVNTKTNTSVTAASSSSSSSSSSALASYYAPAVSSSAANSSSTANANDSATNNPTTVADSWPKLARINKIYATGNNDWVELINPTDHDFDLAAVGYRLEKAKTADDPTLIMRIGNAEDGSYPGGTIIKAHGTYLIVRDDADDFYRAKADAIATRDEFNWPGSGYTLYLGVDAISSSTDPDIIDAVGFGADATYFQGSAPAPEITDNYVLNRIAVNGNNSADFNLILADDPAAIAAVINSNSNNDNNATSTNNVATSTDNIATSTEDMATSTDETADTSDATDDTSDDAATSTDDIATSTDDIATSTSDIATSTAETATSTDAVDSGSGAADTGTAEINKIYATGNNDWVELFNPTDNDFDLATAEYRLEKTKTAQDPSLIMRIGNTEDGSYPGGTIIKAHDKYLIVRDDADDYYKSQADAISTRDEFVWTGSGYTLYLGKGPISSSTDPDIVDAVGFGADATYFQGSAPAPEITDDYILNRVAMSGDNHLDFNLILADDPSIAASADTDNATTTTATTTNADLFVPPTPIVSSGLTNLWHFDECYGSGRWAVGKWGCAREIGYVYDKFSAPLAPAVDLNNFSVSFYYHKSFDYPRADLRLTDNQGDTLRFAIEPAMVTIEGLPNSKWRYYPIIPFNDNLWHKATLVVNQAEDYWAVYLDDKQVIAESFFARLPSMTNIEIGGDCGSVLIDELAIWSRALGDTEIAANYQADAPFSPLAARPYQSAAQLIHFWDFSEDAGLVAKDSIGHSDLPVSADSWIGRSHDNYALKTSYGKSFSVNLNPTLNSSDMSLAFWWRNNDDSTGDGRADIYLTAGTPSDTKLFALMAGNVRVSDWFNGGFNILAEGLDKAIPNDHSWHHLVLTYDSYRYQLTLYEDGEEKASLYLIWMPLGTELKNLTVTTDGPSAEIDDLGIWQGRLSAAQVKEIYLTTK